MAFLFNWSEGKGFFFSTIAILNGMAVVHLVVLGVLGELIVSNSDLSHAYLPEITKRKIILNEEKQEH